MVKQEIYSDNLKIIDTIRPFNDAIAVALEELVKKYEFEKVYGVLNQIKGTVQ